MEKLQEILVNKISTLVLAGENESVQMLDVLNRLLGTVSNWLLNKKAG